MKLIIISVFLFLFSFSLVEILKFTTNNISTWQLQGEVNDSGDINENLEYITWIAPSNYYFYFADGTITSAEEDDLWKHITNHVSTN